MATYGIPVWYPMSTTSLAFLANLISVTHWEKKQYKLWIQPKYNQIIDVADQPVYQFTKEHRQLRHREAGTDYSRTEQKKIFGQLRESTKQPINGFP